MQWVSSRIWTRVAVSISYDDNHYTTGPYQVLSLWGIVNDGNKGVLRIPQSSSITIAYYDVAV